MSPSAESSSALSDYTSAQFNTILIYLSASNFNWIFNSFQHSNWCFFSAYVHFNLIQCLHLNWNLQHFNCHYRFSFFHFYFIQSMSTISKRTTTNFHVWTLLPKHIGCGSYHVFMFCLSFLTSSAPVIHTLTHKHTHIFTAAHSSFLAAVQHYGEKLNLNADICHMHLAADVEVTPMFWRHFFFSLLDQTKLPWISQLWVNKRATRLGQIGLMAGLCLPFAVIYSCVYSSCRYPLWSSVPSSFPAPPPGANEETLSRYIRCDTYPPQPPVWSCVSLVSDTEKNVQFLRTE